MPDAGDLMGANSGRIGKIVLLAVLFFLVLSVAGLCHLRNRQLGFLGGMTDEWFILGANIRLYGTLGVGAKPIVLRPPGYPFFVSIVLLTIGDHPRTSAQSGPHTGRSEDRQQMLREYLERGKLAIYAAQCLLLSLSSLILFLWLSRRLSVGVSFCAALLFGVNPYTVLLTGILHYDILHIFFVLAGCYSLDVALDSKRKLALLLCGILWGAATLVRPISLTLPLFALAIFLVRYRCSLRHVARSATLFLVGMTAAIMPWTIRNYRVTDHLVPVNSQGWMALWGSSVIALDIEPNHYNWYRLFPRYYDPVFFRATGKSYSYSDLIDKTVVIEKEFRRDALANLTRDPGIYLANVAKNIVAFTFGINSVFIKVFQYLQGSGEREVQKAWFVPGARQDFFPGTISTTFAAFIQLLTGLALFGVGVGLRRRDRFLLVPGFTFLCFAASHAATYMDLMYYYLKIPFLFVFAFYGVGATAKYIVRFARLKRKLQVSTTLLALLVGLCLTLTMVII